MGDQIPQPSSCKWCLFALGQKIQTDPLPKVENHAHAVALHFMYYNFVRIHKTLRMTPATAAKVTDKLWEIGDIVKVLEDWES